MSYDIHLIIKILLCWGRSLMSIHMNTNIFTFVPHSEIYLCIFSPDFLVINFPVLLQSCSFQFPDHPGKPMTTVHEYVYNLTSGHFFPKQGEQLDALLKVLPTGRIFLHLSSLGMSQTGGVVLQLLPSSDAQDAVDFRRAGRWWRQNKEALQNMEDENQWDIKANKRNHLWPPHIFPSHPAWKFPHRQWELPNLTFMFGIRI